MSNRWTDIQLEYLKNNYENTNMDELIFVLGKTKASINLKASRLGIGKKRNNTNVNYFDNIDTEEKAYWLGFIYADGYVTINDYGYEFGIELGIVDIEHLSKLKNAMNSENPISTRTRKSGVKVCSFRVYRKELVESLMVVGVIPNKTFKMRIPKLEKELYRHFIRGYFDGDGYVSINKRTTYGINIRTGFVCGTLNFANDILELLNSESDKIHNFQTTNRKDALLILNYLYKDSKVYLERKYNKYLEILEYVNENSLVV